MYAPCNSSIAVHIHTLCNAANAMRVAQKHCTGVISPAMSEMEALLHRHPHLVRFDPSLPHGGMWVAIVHGDYAYAPSPTHHPHNPIGVTPQQPSWQPCGDMETFPGTKVQSQSGYGSIIFGYQPDPTHAQPNVMGAYGNGTFPQQPREVVAPHAWMNIDSIDLLDMGSHEMYADIVAYFEDFRYKGDIGVVHEMMDMQKSRIEHPTQRIIFGLVYGMCNVERGADGVCRITVADMTWDKFKTFIS